MKLSFLIPTHNRPKLFRRCIESVLEQLTDDIEIIVNNDSHDIDEVEHHSISYYYEKFDNLSDIYKFLLSKATGEYVYFLEDDDYLAPMFIDNLKLDADLIVGNYLPLYKVQNPIFYATLNADARYIDNAEGFVQSLNFEHLQLSQHVFRRSTIENFKFPDDNNVYNDINLVLHAATQSNSIRTTRQVFYCQTTDGGDNLSFAGSNTEVPVTQSMDFLKDYEIFKTTSPTTRS